MKRFIILLYSLLSGLLLSLAWTEWCSGLVLIVAFLPLLFVENYFYVNRNRLRSINLFLYSYLTFFTWNILSTWWIINATVAGMISAIIFNSLFMAIVFWLYHISKIKFGTKTGAFSLVFLWISFEYLHLNWELSWSWLNLGNGLAKNVRLIQWYEYTGILGGTFWIIACNIMLISSINNYQLNRLYSGFWRKLIITSLIIICPIIISLSIYYLYEEQHNPHQIVVIQPNIDPYNEKFNGMPGEEQLKILLDLALQNADSNTEYIVGPETAIPTVIWENDIPYSNGYKSIHRFLSGFPDVKFVLGLSSGKVYRENETHSLTARKFENAQIYYDLYNTAIQIDTGSSFQLYHKSKLVLGVEKMPFKKVLGFLDKFAADLGGTTGSLGIQDQRTVFNSGHDSIKIGTLICYESIFGEYVTEYVKNGADYLFVITNDGWWGDTPGYRQHLHYSQLRAVETRRSIARSANTGISCFIDQKGELIQPTHWWTRTAIKSSINANDKLTFYTRYGDYLGRISVIILGITLIYCTIFFFKNKKSIS